MGKDIKSSQNKERKTTKTKRKNNMLYKNEKYSTDPIGGYIDNKCYNTLTSKLLLEYENSKVSRGYRQEH